MSSIKVAIIGVGNCASSLVQGKYHYANSNKPHGLIHEDVGGYKVGDIEFVAAFDVDSRKVGLDLGEAIFAKPNCTKVFHAEVPKTGTIVRMGAKLDGVAGHMLTVANDRGFEVDDTPDSDRASIVSTLKESGAEVLVNFLPVGSQAATEFYMECAIEAGLAVVNCMPVFIASQPEWEARFAKAGLPIIGDDVKAQVGATIVHRVLSNLFKSRGVTIDHTYQLNTGGNTDFLNMSNHRRLASKKVSKTEAVQSVAAERLEDENVHIGPSDYVPWQNDNKVCFLRMEGAMFGGVPMNLELRLSVEDSPNSAGVAIDMIRCAKLAKDRGLAGPIDAASAYFCKHPRTQMTDDIAQLEVEKFIAAA